MKLKYYLRGAGAGIVFATVILMVAFHIHNKNISNSSAQVEKTEYTENTIGNAMLQDEKPKSDDGIKPEPDPIVETTQLQDTQNTETEDMVENASDVEETLGEEEPEELLPAEESPSQKTSDSTAETSGKKSFVEQDGNIIITVVSGEVCRDVAEDLEDAGLVEDAEEFRLYMGEQGYGRSLHTGNFVIPKGSSFEEIASILVK